MRENERKKRKRENKRRKKGRQERCPHDVPKMLLAEMFKTIDILAEMLKI